MYGIPQCLHLDNAAEFHSRALRSGCAQYGMELMYRPVGKPHYGGHVERLNRTLMQRLKGLPGATGNSTQGRKVRQPEKHACGVEAGPWRDRACPSVARPARLPVKSCGWEAAPVKSRRPPSPYAPDHSTLALAPHVPLRDPADAAEPPAHA
jgi:transposase InsO family protein